MKTPSIRIVDAKPSKKNPNAKFKVEYVAKNGELLAPSETFNDAKAVKTHIAAIRNCVVITLDESSSTHRVPQDHTAEQKFAKSGYALPKPEQKKK
jgi:uncharacterized protein YegP (UPF0339 family)